MPCRKSFENSFHQITQHSINSHSFLFPSILQLIQLMRMTADTHMYIQLLKWSRVIMMMTFIQNNGCSPYPVTIYVYCTEIWVYCYSIQTTRVNCSAVWGESIARYGNEQYDCCYALFFSGLGSIPLHYHRKI